MGEFTHHIRTRDREDFCFFGGRDRQEEGEASARKCFTFPPLWIDLTPRDDGKDASAANGGFVPHSSRSGSLRFILGEQQSGMVPRAVQNADNDDFGIIGAVEYLVIAMDPAPDALLGIARHQRMGLWHFAEASAFGRQFRHEGLCTGRVVAGDVIPDGE